MTIPADELRIMIPALLARRGLLSGVQVWEEVYKDPRTGLEAMRPDLIDLTREGLVTRYRACGTTLYGAAAAQRPSLDDLARYGLS